MIALKIVKNGSFMSKILAGDAFDSFLLEEARIRMAVTWDIDGHLNEQFYPADVLRKKIAARAAVMSQSGQYNFPRCMNRGDLNAAYLATAEFVKSAVSMLYLLERIYMPFYKWSFRGMQDFTVCLQPARQLSQLIGLGNGSETAAQRQTLIESICTSVAQELQKQGFSNTTDPFLQNHLPAIMGGITDPQIRQLHVMADAD